MKRDLYESGALYDSLRWKNLRRAKLRAQPLCERHAKGGKIAKATVVHHRKPHRGDPAKFFVPIEDLESLCKPCHDSEGQIEDKQGFAQAIGEDGWPLDPAHPFNKGWNEQ